jgi:hypothetical protein
LLSPVEILRTIADGFQTVLMSKRDTSAAHNNGRYQGEFNRLSQHLMKMEVSSGSSTAGCGSSGASKDALSRSPAVRS